MGSWDSMPWDNDGAADWFGDLFDKTELARHVERTLGRDVECAHEEIRAAASLLVLLGRPYVWPISDLQRHLELAASKLESVRSLEIYSESPELVASIEREIAVLRSRAKREYSVSADEASRSWWESWM